jgi:hypothetical protein
VLKDPQTDLLVHIYAPFRIFASKLHKLQIIEESSLMAWKKDHNILFGMIEMNKRDMRKEAMEEQLNINKNGRRCTAGSEDVNRPCKKRIASEH